MDIIPSLIKGIKQLNFENPTPVQKEAIPAGIQGNDILTVAQTGSGKTLAFGIPMLQRLSQMKRGTGLVVVPTRELAIQVDEQLQALSRLVRLRSAVLIGGASMSLQLNALQKKPRLIIATPGRLMDHIARKSVDLSNTKVLILDEADRMLDMGFAPDIKKIVKSIPGKRQTMLFSATMPKAIEAIADKFMEDPTRIEISRSGATPVEVSHEMFVINKRDKSRLLAFQLKQCSGPVLVFTKTKWMARKLTTKVNNMGFAAAEIHSNRSQGQRQTALEGFKRGRYQVLIATDIAARGIDVSGIELVVNYDMPANSEDYVHRIGRTGRAGKTGHAISYATTDQKGSIGSIERFMNTKLAISALPTLPSEKLLMRKADQSNLRNESAGDDKPLKRKASKKRLSKRQDFKKRISRKSAVKRIELKQNSFKRKDPNRKYASSRNSDGQDRQ
ncbi:MAG: DEAD/DEAH box helicase [candidate division Zixibacteria bacterium]|nr:DEAD/DEAH box helicase [candidate division Zixibacteria bacterium]